MSVEERAMWLVAGVAVVLGGLAVVVASLAEPDLRVAPSRSGPVTPRDLRVARFPIVWRGYDPGHVDAMLARAAAALEDAQRYGTGALDDGALPGFLARTFDDEPDPGREPTSGEELEGGGGDGPGGLDR